MINNNKKQWDDKFGMIAIEGVGKDAEVVVNNKGGKQSKAPMAMHLIDPDFLDGWFEETDSFIKNITLFMKNPTEKHYLHNAVFELACNKYDGELSIDDKPLIDIAKVLQEGAEKYEANNWRLIPQEEHINHALIHYMAFKMGDKQDDHLEHCMCRLMMAYATEKSDNFDYCSYVA